MRDSNQIRIMNFSIFYADPPWSFVTYSNKGKDRSPERHYPTMSLAELCALPVGSLAAPDCALFLWANGPRLPDAFALFAAWGFTYKAIAFTWVKQNRSGVGFPIGCGYWTRANPEICLLATRGKPKRIDAGVPNLLMTPRREHSRKPDEIRERIVRLMGDVPRLELFARQRTPGWQIWGNEAPGGSDVAMCPERSLFAYDFPQSAESAPPPAGRRKNDAGPGAEPGHFGP
jgi:N6-adenosine-specific RNA methylase IME4